MATWANNWYPYYPPPATPYGYPAHLHPWPGPASPPGTVPHPSIYPTAAHHHSHSAEPYSSHRYPNLNPALAVDSTTVRYDVRKPAHEGVTAAVYGTYHQMPATATPVSHMRLYSSLFPWTVEIIVPTGTPITCKTVWDAIHEALKPPIVDSEWGVLMESKKHRELMKKAMKERRERDGDSYLKRIDWLGTSRTFMGLEKDDEFIRARLLPGVSECSETWMMKFS
jgi:hypothetical protein